MHILWEELSAGVPDMTEFARITIRLVGAMVLAAVLGYDRERAGKAAGLRTHILVALGAALFVLIPAEAGLDIEGMSRVIQGVATGIGFLGAGAILKLNDEREIEGLTTAASIWVTAAIGLAAGLGRLGAAALSVLLAWITLSLLLKYGQNTPQKPEPNEP